MRTRLPLLALTALLAASTLAFAPRASMVDLAPQYIGPYGGPGGTTFSRTCGPDHVMTGFRARSGLALDAIGLLCRPVGADGQLGAEVAVGALAGGSGGTASSARCPAGSVAAGFIAYHSVTVVGLTVTCRNWIASSRRFGTTSTTLAAGVVSKSLVVAPSGGMCSQDVQPIRSLRGRSGNVVDALGVTCNEP
jgi:hypothetical protein